MFNYLNFLESCNTILENDSSFIKILYYSHFITIVISLLIGFFVFYKVRNFLSKILLLTTIIFSVWGLANLIVWMSSNSLIVMFSWSILEIFDVLFFIFCFYFFRIYLRDGLDISIFEKILLFSFLFPVIIFTPTVFNLIGFNYSYCEAIDSYLNIYIFFAEIILIIAVILSYLYFLYKNRKNNLQKTFIFFGVFLFLFSFFSLGYVAEFFNNIYIEPYGLFGITFFVGFLAYSIVKLKAFNIKLLGAQALVWPLIILVGSQLLYQADMQLSSLILTAITLIISAIIGLLVVRSVKKVDSQREELARANQNQQSLIHFITHQVKGYLTKSRNIFDGMIAGDYGQMPQEASTIIKHGFDSDTRGVETVMSILRASDLRSGKTEFKKEKANISAMVAEVIEFRKDMAAAKNLDLTFEIEPNIEGNVDVLQLKEVFKNLITNSILYTPRGTVHVVLKKENGKIKFSVVDTGVGLSPKDKQNLFTEGGKGEESLKSNADSTGYGLFIAKQIIDKHQGTIGAISEGRDKGSEFFVILPDVQ